MQLKPSFEQEICGSAMESTYNRKPPLKIAFGHAI
jgi:hypothetical protein